MTLEKKIERQIRQICDDMRCLYIKFDQPGVIGAPDRLILAPAGNNGIALFLEVKRPGETPGVHQTAYLTRLQNMGFHARWTDRATNVRGWIDDAIHGRKVPTGGDPLYL